MISHFCCLPGLLIFLSSPVHVFLFKNVLIYDLDTPKVFAISLIILVGTFSLLMTSFTCIFVSLDFKFYKQIIGVYNEDYIPNSDALYIYIYKQLVMCSIRFYCPRAVFELSPSSMGWVVLGSASWCSEGLGAVLLCSLMGHLKLSQDFLFIYLIGLEVTGLSTIPDPYPKDKIKCNS